MIESNIFSVKILRLNGITILSNNELNHPFFFGGKGLSQIMVLLVMKNSEKSILNFVDVRILEPRFQFTLQQIRAFRNLQKRNHDPKQMGKPNVMQI